MRRFSVAVAAGLILISSAALAQRPPQFSRPGMGAPRDPAEATTYSAAIAEPNLSARISAIQQFLVAYPNSTLRQPAIGQLLAAQRQIKDGGGSSAMPGPVMSNPAPPQTMTRTATTTAPISTPAPASTAPTTPRDSLLQHTPNHAEITITPHSITVKADNSTLSQILRDISGSTGMKIDGLSSAKDERIFGSYGPGEAREVLLSLLQGSGYNVLMVGDVAGGAPRQLSLSTRSSSPAANSTANNVTATGEEDGSEDTEQEMQQPPQPEPIQSNVPVGEGTQQPPRSPQQIIQEMQNQRLREQNQPPPQN